jgi:hypothetical protein
MWKRVVLLLSLGSMLVVTAAPASASKGTAKSSDGGAKSIWTFKPATLSLVGVLTDLSAGNGLCARVYVRGYSTIGGWEAWRKAGERCDGTAGPWARPILYPYTDRVQLKVCDGGTAAAGARCGTVVKIK